MPSFRDNMMDNGVELAVGIFVVFILMANLLPTAFSQVFNTTSDLGNGTASNWSSDVVTLWELLPLIGVIVLLLLVVGWATDRI
jgi:type II secretory pathway component PulF